MKKRGNVGIFIISIVLFFILLIFILNLLVEFYSQQKIVNSRIDDMTFNNSGGFIKRQAELNKTLVENLYSFAINPFRAFLEILGGDGIILTNAYGCINDEECDDNNACTTGSCNTGNCQFVNNTNLCNDNDPCTTLDTCSGGICRGASKNCADGDICTRDFCDPLEGCMNVDIPGCSCEIDNDCNDRNSCTIDACFNGSCRYNPISCDNGGICINGSCIVENDVQASLMQENTDVCRLDADCNDNNTCTLDKCDVAAGQCGTMAIVCEDYDYCTLDNCEPNIGCQHALVTCNDGDDCTEDFCFLGGCFNWPKSSEEKCRNSLTWITSLWPKL